MFRGSTALCEDKHEGHPDLRHPRKFLKIFPKITLANRSAPHYKPKMQTSRRNFLTGLLSTAALVATTPVVRVLPPAPTNDDLLVLLYRRIEEVNRVTRENMLRNIFDGQPTSRLGAMNDIHRVTHELMVRVLYGEPNILFDDPEPRYGELYPHRQYAIPIVYETK